MYITYETEHYDRYFKKGKWRECYQPPKKVPSKLPKPDFMPTRLVRTSDMTIVDGSQVNEGYCALSYSWNQSGEILHNEVTGEYERIDEGKHKIVSYCNNISPNTIVPRDQTHCNDRLWKIYEVLLIMDNNNLFFTKTIEYVKFEGIIQQICQKLNIKYIWYNQMCVNQDDKKEKYHEIRNIYHVYNSAYLTVALVPEFTRDVNFETIDTEYFECIWTLQEESISKRLVFVGKNTHIWGEEILAEKHNWIYTTRDLVKPFSELTVSQLLYHAHMRKSTKDHDRVFAIINLFPDIMQHIAIDYDQPFEDLMIQFYGHLAKMDLSILLFGYNYGDYATIHKYKFLPSWTGINGRHSFSNLTTPFRNYDIVGKTMYMTSEFVPSCQPINDDSLTIRKEDLPSPPDDISDGNNELDYRLCIVVQLPGTNETRIIEGASHSYYAIFNEEEQLDEISKVLKQLSRFMEIKKETLFWCHEQRDEYKMVTYINLHHLTEDMDDPSAQYMILSEVSFEEDNEDTFFYYPVIKKREEEEYYKAIGCYYTASSNKVFFSGCNLPKQTFLIQ